MPPLLAPLQSFRRWSIGIATISACVACASLSVAPSRTASAAAIVAGMTCGVASATACSRTRRRGATRSIPLARNLVDEAGPLIDVLDRCEEALVFTDTSLRIWYANDAFVALAGRSIGAAAGTTIVDALAHRIADDASFASTAAELATHGDREAHGEITRVAPPARDFEWRSVPLRDASGTICGRGFLFHDRSQARELAGLKSDFLSTVTHELRTPLTSVKGSLQLVLGKSTALSPIDSELLHISLKNADRLIRLINDLLDISRLELGKIELTFAKVSTGSLVEEAVSGLRAYASGREITVGCAIVPDVPAVAGDRDRLIQVLTNLISNAVKFSPTGGHVDVSAICHDDEVHISVRDSGIGIPAADQARLFQRFQRLHPGHSGEPGSGLGLAISKAIVERHGGRILLSSREHEGSTFTLVLPAMREIKTPLRTQDGDASRPAILVVDDDRSLGAVLRDAWKDRYDVTWIERGIEALDTARHVRPDLVLLDVVLPDLSGYDVLRILRTTTATAAIPVIMLTVQPEHALSANLGAVDVVAKPFDVEQLTRTVDQVLADRPGPAATRIAIGG